MASSSRVPNYDAARIRRRTALNNTSTTLAASIPASIPASRATTRRPARLNTLGAGILSRLQGGRGITESEQEGLFGRCNFVDSTFSAAFSAVTSLFALQDRN